MLPDTAAEAARRCSKIACANAPHRPGLWMPRLSQKSLRNISRITPCKEIKRAYVHHRADGKNCGRLCPNPHRSAGIGVCRHRATPVRTPAHQEPCRRAPHDGAHKPSRMRRLAVSTGCGCGMLSPWNVCRILSLWDGTASGSDVGRDTDSKPVTVSEASLLRRRDAASPRPEGLACRQGRAAVCVCAPGIRGRRPRCSASSWGPSQDGRLGRATRAFAGLLLLHVILACGRMGMGSGSTCGSSSSTWGPPMVEADLASVWDRSGVDPGLTSGRSRTQGFVAVCAPLGPRSRSRGIWLRAHRRATRASMLET